MPERDRDLSCKLIKLNQRYQGLGSKKLSFVLGKKGFRVNHKAVDRVRRKLGLVAKRKKKRKLFVEPIQLPKVSRPREVWSVDFVHNRLDNHAPFRCFTCIDILDRQVPGILVKSSIRAIDVIKFLEGMGKLPKGFILDNGTEFRSVVFERWCSERNIKLHFTQKASPYQNGYVESFNGRFRSECLELNKFRNLRDAKRKIEAWRKYYNTDRPHGALGMLTPVEYSHRLTRCKSGSKFGG